MDVNGYTGIINFDQSDIYFECRLPDLTISKAINVTEQKGHKGAQNITTDSHIKNSNISISRTNSNRIYKADF